MRPVQSLSTGLLGLLSLKAQGETPDVLSKVISPTLDIEGFFLRAQSNSYISTGGNLAVGLLGQVAAFAAVPAGFWRWVQQWNCEVVVAAGETLKACTLAWATGPGQVRIAGPAESVASAAGGRLITPSVRDVWLPPGAFLGFGVLENGLAAPAAFTGYARYVDIPV